MSRRRIDGYTLAIVDLLTALTITFAAMAVLAILVTKRTPPQPVEQGQLIVVMQWDKTSNSDMDLWVKAPDDAPVGFSHPGDRHCNLLRDDLGRQLDPESRNEEMVVCRGNTPGEWIVNVMAYHIYDDHVPIGIHVTVSRLTESGVYTILDSRVVLRSQGEQLTVGRFSLDSDGYLVPGSINDLPAELYVGLHAYGHGGN